MAASVFFARNFVLKNLRFPTTLNSSRYLCSKDDENVESKNETKTKQVEKKNEATKKLASLLATIKVEGSMNNNEAQGPNRIKLDLAKPVLKTKPEKEIIEEIPKEKIALDDNLNKELHSAVRSVAQSITKNDPLLTSSDVAPIGTPDPIDVTESELLQRLKMHFQESVNVRDGKIPPQGGAAPSIDLGKVVLGMKIDRLKAPVAPIRTGMHFEGSSMEGGDQLGPRGWGDRGSRGGGERWADQNNFNNKYDSRRPKRAPSNRFNESRPDRHAQQSQIHEKINLFGGDPLGIFQPKIAEKDSTQTQTQAPLSVWDKLSNYELRLLTNHHPKNAFEEMIGWTERGKLWHYPIDNEQGLAQEKEGQVEFHQHVFLEQELERGFPPRGPVRHFMELVVVGLSKNPYLTVERKHIHIDWFRNYFKEKEVILKESGALG